MELKTFKIKGNTPFLMYLLSDVLVKKLNKEFQFYNVRFYREERAKELTVCLDYPKGNVYWFLEFQKYIFEEIFKKDIMYVKDWNLLLKSLKMEINDDYTIFRNQVFGITASEVVNKQLMYNLRQYQAFDLCQLLIKMKSSENMSGLILSEQRTGKTRIAISAAIELLQSKNGNCLIVCPKSSIAGWVKELEEMALFTKIPYNINVVKNVKSASDIISTGLFEFNIITYDLLKRLSVNQKKTILGIPKYKDIMLIGDECHRLRNFKTLQSDAVFALKTICSRAKVNLSVLGITGTPAVKDSYDIFGSLGFINFSKISLSPTVKDFNEFKEYFYNCEDTSYGKYVGL